MAGKKRRKRKRDHAAVSTSTQDPPAEAEADAAGSIEEDMPISTTPSTGIVFTTGDSGATGLSTFYSQKESNATVGEFHDYLRFLP